MSTTYPTHEERLLSNNHLQRRALAFVHAIESLPPGKYQVTITREASGFRWHGLPLHEYRPSRTPAMPPPRPIDNLRK